MWKTFQNNEDLYMIKVEQGESLTVYLSDLENIWFQNISKDCVLKQFLDANPLVDIKINDAVTQIVDLINNISQAVNIEFLKTSDALEMVLKFIKSEFDMEFKFDFRMLPTGTFLKEITVPLIQTVRYLEEQQQMLCNLIAKKDRELEEYQLEKGVISREDLITEKFDEELIKNVNENSMINVFGNSKPFWDTFTEKYGNIKVAVQSIQIDPWNHIKRKRRVYSSKTALKKGKGINYSEKN